MEVDTKIFGVIYGLRNKINNKHYIGQHAGPRPEKRWRQHNHKKTRCTALKNAIKKYGWDNFDKFVVEYCVGGREELDAMEKKYIIQYNSLAPNGYNLREGGMAGKPCLLVRQRMSIAMKGKYVGVSNPFFGKKHSDETRSIMSELRRGTSPWNKGIKMSDEARLRMSIAGKGRTPWNKNMSEDEKAARRLLPTKPRPPVSLDTRLKMRLAKLGRSQNLSAEARYKRGSFWRGKPAPNRGKPAYNRGKKGPPMSEERKAQMKILMTGHPVSAETRAKISAGNKKKIHQFNMDGTFVREWSSLTEASAFFLTDVSVICGALTSKSQSSQGYLWRHASSDKPLPVNFRQDVGRKEVYQFSQDNVLIRKWESLTDASRECKINASNISMVCKGKRQSAGGFVWKYMEDLS